MPAASVSRSDDRVAERGPQAKVSDSSSLIESKNVNFSSLKSGLPMGEPTPEPRVRSNLNPAAEGFMPWPPGCFDQGQDAGQFLLQQVSQSLLAWHQREGCAGVQPWLWRDPMHGSALGLGPSANMTPAGGEFRGPA